MDGLRAGVFHITVWYCTWATYSYSAVEIGGGCSSRLWSMTLSFPAFSQIEAICRHFFIGVGGQTDTERETVRVCVCVWIESVFFGSHKGTKRHGRNGSVFVLWPSTSPLSYIVYHVGLCCPRARSTRVEYLFATPLLFSYSLNSKSRGKNNLVQLQTAFWVSIVDVKFHPHEPQACPFVGGFHFHTHSPTHSHHLINSTEVSSRLVSGPSGQLPRNTFWCLRKQT